MFAGQFMMGAQDRLLPPSIPFRFFATAVLFHLAGWVVLLAGAQELPGFMGGLGLGLAGLHLMTLGVLAMTAMGAAFQLLPVATSRQLGPNWACRLTWWIYTPGVAVLTLGMATQFEWALHLGGMLVAGGLILFGVLVGRNLLQVSELPGVTRHAWVALASLAGVVVLGLALIDDVQGGFLPNRAAVASAHAILAGYGFMGSLALGFSYVLVPMFVLSQGVPDKDGRHTATLTALSLIVAATGAAMGSGMVAALGGIIGLSAIGLHLRALLAVLETRMRKRLETFFRMVKAAWMVLPVTVFMGLFLALGGTPELTAPLWGWLLVFGWLLTFVTGILQRIMPFLASMHSGANGGKPALMSRLVADRPLLIHAIAHGLAVTLVAAGLLAQAPLLVRAGAASGLIGAVSFTLFAVELMRRYRAHEIANSRNKGPSSC